MLLVNFINCLNCINNYIQIVFKILIIKRYIVFEFILSTKHSIYSLIIIFEQLSIFLPKHIDKVLLKKVVLFVKTILKCETFLF